MKIERVKLGDLHINEFSSRLRGAFDEIVIGSDGDDRDLANQRGERRIVGAVVQDPSFAAIESQRNFLFDILGEK